MHYFAEPGTLNVVYQAHTSEILGGSLRAGCRYGAFDTDEYDEEDHILFQQNQGVGKCKLGRVASMKHLMTAACPQAEAALLAQK